ncbi:MAG: hypothetical protein L0Z62_01050 [Gemmataceae bacterium]|nr:hypothetical protein [Gemmataceae bacterium]
MRRKHWEKQLLNRKGEIMADHAASYLLAEVLATLDRYKVFRLLGPNKARKMVAEIVERACEQYDCHAGDILEEYGAKLGICWVCLSTRRKLQEGVCRECARQEGPPDEGEVGLSPEAAVERFRQGLHGARG